MATGGVFINYRGADSHAYGALLYAELSSRFGPDLVFLDSESIPAGSDFESCLLDRVREASVVLAVIGPGWLAAADSAGRRCVDDPADWIRRELAEAFAAGATVIPVLVDGAVLPVDGQLPDDIARLGRCQYRQLRHRDARADVERLVADLAVIDPRFAGRIHGGTGPILVGRPPLRADAFQQRPALRDLLTRGATAQVVAGDGGTGKSQLAAAAFDAELPSVDVAVWITATTRAGVLSAYAEAYSAVHGTAAADGQGDAEQQANRLLGWLAGTRRRWLIVLDDVVDPAELRGLWPAGPGGRMVVTTRRRDAALLARGQVIDVGTFTRAESMAYLAAKFGRAPGVPAGVLDRADRLAEELGDLPLALSHTAATIINDGITCADYQALLVDGAHRLADLLPADPVDAGDDYAHTVSGTWSLARDRADRLAPVGLAGALLDVIAFLDPNGIPEAALTCGPVREHLAAVARPGRDPVRVSAEQARRAVRNLWRLSLVSHDPDDPARSVRMHALAQRAGIERLAPTATAHTIRVAADALTRIWPPVEAGTTLGQILRANASVLVGRHATALWRPATHPLVFRLGSSLSDSGLGADAAAYFAGLTTDAVRNLGADHPDTLLARHHLARSRGEAGDPNGAAAAFGDLLVDRLRVLGPDHQDTLATRGNIGWWRGISGDPAAAVAVFDELLADRSRVLGVDHPHTLATRNSLARWHGRAGDLAVATAIFEALLVDELRLLGADHPDTLTTRNNLAHVRGEAGDPVGAAAEIRQVLAGRQRLLGPDHPRTLTTRAHLARWRGEAGDAVGAATDFADVLADELRLFGPDHPRTLTTRAHLARWRGESGDPAGAVATFADILAVRRRVLGSRHPDVNATEHALRYWRRRSSLGSAR